MDKVDIEKFSRTDAQELLAIIRQKYPDLVTNGNENQKKEIVQVKNIEQSNANNVPLLVEQKNAFDYNALLSLSRPSQRVFLS